MVEERKWHGVSVLPRAGEVLETRLRELAPAVCRCGKVVRSAGFAPTSPEWRSGVLLLDDGRGNREGNGPGLNDWAECAARASRMDTRAAYTTKRTNTAAPIRLGVEGRTRRNHFTAVLSVFQAHLPCVTKYVSYARPLDWKMPGRGNHQTIQGC